jgi:hypothetical protein
VRKLEDVQPEAKPAADRPRAAADDTPNAGASTDAPLRPAPETLPNG